MKLICHIILFSILGLIWPSLSVYAIEELPLGSTKADVVKNYGKPDQHPIYSGPGPKATEEDLANSFIYHSAEPPRFYNFREDKAFVVHYYDLSGKKMDFILKLLEIHAQKEKIDEIDPRTLGHDPTGLGIAKAWRCSTRNWTALYRAYKETSPSLLIYINESEK